MYANPAGSSVMRPSSEESVFTQVRYPRPHAAYTVLVCVIRTGLGWPLFTTSFSDRPFLPVYDKSRMHVRMRVEETVEVRVGSQKRPGWIREMIRSDSAELRHQSSVEIIEVMKVVIFYN